MNPVYRPYFPKKRYRRRAGAAALIQSHVISSARTIRANRVRANDFAPQSQLEDEPTLERKVTMIQLTRL
jgi:hypothetical protein